MKQADEGVTDRSRLTLRTSEVLTDYSRHHNNGIPASLRSIVTYLFDDLAAAAVVVAAVSLLCLLM